MYLKMILTLFVLSIFVHITIYITLYITALGSSLVHKLFPGPIERKLIPAACLLFDSPYVGLQATVLPGTKPLEPKVVDKMTNSGNKSQIFFVLQE